MVLCELGRIECTLLAAKRGAAPEHINLNGDYLWRNSAKIGAGKFRPLRLLQPD
ncbi:hypothetical protein [Xylella fastidiosa]|uniref:hypothetical protein n=1 Tax=Xylella fastidiosa TaxID=2371 RepID=UPI0003ECF2E2|nr:hypothetical protein [Xylella fastidiosa]AIC13731.1 hypothetical protein P303_05030 [Xylella fastidiosa MUL0034]EWG13511.1 hypothetical protein P910_003226 [Xylella fastidiosa Mul-MD]KFA40534.1 hypothetical protein DF22_002972 [Xylella fastidiosa]MDD0908840.1 hypothetical protein [Xylella fastidiosa subsp. multiplex]UIT49046.1 hypothetical protein LZ754_05405 [Xylella fastidiosa subsp. multiplex]